jgi:hypothetical protein
MAELLIVVVVVAAVLLYAADRARKLRVRARQMSGMNDRLAVAAAKIDEEQQRKRARVTASAELTSVLPAIKRPPLTIPGMGGHEPGDEEAAPAAAEAPAAREAPAAVKAPAAQAPAAEGTLIMPPVPDQGPDRPGGARVSADQVPDEYTSSQERTSRR